MYVSEVSIDEPYFSINQDVTGIENAFSVHEQHAITSGHNQIYRSCCNTPGRLIFVHDQLPKDSHVKKLPR